MKDDLKTIAPAPTEGDTSSSPSSSSPASRGPKGSHGNGGNGGHDDGQKTLRQRAMDKLESNPSQLGDPTSLKAETADSEPTENDRGAGKSKL